MKPKPRVGQIWCDGKYYTLTITEVRRDMVHYIWETDDQRIIDMREQHRGQGMMLLKDLTDPEHNYTCVHDPYPLENFLEIL